MNQNDLYLKYAEIIKMCKGTALEDKPWVCVRFNGSEFYDHPRFDTLAKNYQFAVAILEGRPVFVGDTLYWKTTGEEYIVNSYNKCTSMPLGYMTWQPPKPKRRIVLEETEERNNEYQHGGLPTQVLALGLINVRNADKIWRIIEDTWNKP